MRVSVLLPSSKPAVSTAQILPLNAAGSSPERRRPQPRRRLPLTQGKQRPGPGCRAFRDCQRGCENARAATKAGLDQGRRQGWVRLLHAYPAARLPLRCAMSSAQAFVAAPARRMQLSAFRLAERLVHFGPSKDLGSSFRQNTRDPGCRPSWAGGLLVRGYASHTGKPGPPRPARPDLGSASQLRRSSSCAGCRFYRRMQRKPMWLVEVSIAWGWRAAGR